MNYLWVSILCYIYFIHRSTFILFIEIYVDRVQHGSVWIVKYSMAKLQQVQTSIVNYCQASPVLSSMAKHRKVQSSIVKYRQGQSRIVQYNPIQSSIDKDSQVQSSMIQYREAQTSIGKNSSSIDKYRLIQSTIVKYRNPSISTPYVTKNNELARSKN